MRFDALPKMDNQYNDEEYQTPKCSSKQSNVLTLWGNERTMNLNPLILTNIQSSHYFKVNLYELKTYHEVVDEIYYKVTHLEPWEKGSRRTSGQTGMCGGVRGVGAGGIVSTAYCLLYKLFTLKLTRKQLNGLITHVDSPYIRALGFMYIRYALPPSNLVDWYEAYLDDEEEMDVKAGGGQIMRLGMILRQWLVKLEWFSTLFPRIPVPIQQKIQKLLDERFPNQVQQPGPYRERENDNNRQMNNERPTNRVEWRNKSPVRVAEEIRERDDKDDRSYRTGQNRERGGENYGNRDSERRDRDRKAHRDRERMGSPKRERSPYREARDRSRDHRDRYRPPSRDKEYNKHKRDRHRR